MFSYLWRVLRKKSLLSEEELCAKAFAIGATVYRPTNYAGGVEAGVITSIRRVNYGNSGDWYEDHENGAYPLYTAGFVGDYASQTTRLKFYDTEAGAWKAVAAQLRRLAKEARGHAVTYRKMAKNADKKAGG